MYRIIIADDEKIECRALEMMIQNDFPELEIVPCAYNGAELITNIKKYRPDIAVVDINMPEISGLDALEMIRAGDDQLKIIISSAYSEFEYAKRAMKLGVFDYILKPVDKRNFEDALEKVIRTLRSERNEERLQKNAQEHMDEMTEVAGKEFLSSLILGEADRKSFLLYRKFLNQEYNGGILAAVRFFDKGEKVRNGEQKLICWLEQELRKFCCCTGKVYKDEIYFLILPGGHVPEHSHRKWLTDILEMLCAASEKQNGYGIGFGVSCWKYDSEEMVAGLTECRIAIRNQGRPGVYFYENPVRQRMENPFMELEEKCMQWLKFGKIDLCLPEISEVFQRIRESEVEIEVIKVQLLEFFVPICGCLEQVQDCFIRYAKSAKIDYDALHKCKNIDEIEKWICESLHRLLLKTDSREKKSREYVERTILFMEQHYMEDISLENAADNSGISSFYLSRLLKQELKQTFVEILTDIRMHKALNLLWNRSYTVREIAEKSGYGNLNYFYKVFKKYTGMNVGEMRQYLE